MRPRRSGVAILLACVFVSLSACGRSAGTKCKAGESACQDKKNAFACHDGFLVGVPCNGPLGCNKVGDRAVCDTSTASVGDACMATGDEEYACSPDKKKALVCKNRKFEVYLECRGKGGCAQLGQQVSCDTSLADKNDPCKTEGAVSCSSDGREMVICHEGRYAAYRFCRGQYGCSLKNEVPQCDETLSVENDPCGLPNYVVCSVDGQSELVCQGSTFQRSRPCRKGCTVTNRPGRPIECE
jgi:hypothetical protein